MEFDGIVRQPWVEHDSSIGVLFSAAIWQRPDGEREETEINWGLVRSSQYHRVVPGALFKMVIGLSGEFGGTHQYVEFFEPDYEFEARWFNACQNKARLEDPDSLRVLILGE